MTLKNEVSGVLNTLIIEQCDGSIDELSWRDLLPITVAGNIYSFEVVEDFGGEGMGDHMYVVLRINKNEKLLCHVKYSGWYSSWDGSEWETDFDIVEPVTVQKIEYRKVK